MGSVPRMNTRSWALLSQTQLPWQHKHLSGCVISLIPELIQLEKNKSGFSQAGFQSLLLTLLWVRLEGTGALAQEQAKGRILPCGKLPWGDCTDTSKKRNIAQILPEGEKGKKSSPSKEQWRLLNKRFSAKYLPQDKSIDKKRLSKSIFFFFMSWFFSLGDVQVETTKQKKILWKTQDRYFPLSIIGYFKFCYAKGIQTANCVNPEA